MDDVEKVARISAIVDEQANDPGLWFQAETAAEAYVQQALRRLHAAIEGKTPDECARAALSALGGRDEAIDGLGDFLYAIEPIAARPGPYGTTVSISPVEARLLLSALRRPTPPAKGE